MDWSTRGQAEVEIGGEIVKVRRVDQIEMMAALGNLPTMAPDGPAATPDQQLAYVRFWLEHGTVEPRVWAGAYDDTPAGRVHVSAFSAVERERILNAILAASGIPTGGAAEAIRTFPEGAAGGDAGPGVQPVWNDPHGVSKSAGG